MSFPNGYVGLDLSGFDYGSSTTVTIDGIFARMAAVMGTGKPIVLYNCMYLDRPVEPQYVTAHQATDTNPAAYVIYLNTSANRTIQISADDTVNAVTT